MRRSRAFGQRTAGDERLVAVEGGQFAQFVFQGCTVHAGFGTYVQQFQIDFIGFQRTGITGFQSFFVESCQLFGVLQTFVEEGLLTGQHDDVEAGFLCLQQNVLAQGKGLGVERLSLVAVHAGAGDVERREVETLCNDHFAHGDVLVVRIPQMGVRQGWIGQVIGCPVFQFLGIHILGIGLQLPVVLLYLGEDGFNAVLGV